jgi:hypothetical protein
MREVEQGNFGWAACEACMATWDLGANSAFALAPRKIAETLKTEFLLNNNTNSVRTSQETHYVPATKPNRLMLFGEIVAVYCENHMEHTDTLCGQNASK